MFKEIIKMAGVALTVCVGYDIVKKGGAAAARAVKSKRSAKSTEKADA